MRIKVLSNFGGSLIERNNHLITIEGIGHDMEEAGWTLAIPAWMDGEVGTCEWYDLASGDFYEFEQNNSYDAQILLENAGGKERIKQLVEKFFESEKAH